MFTYRLRRALSQILLFGSLIILAAGAATTFTGIRIIAPGLWVGAGIAGLGLSALLAGELIASSEPRPFTARGQVVRGELDVRAGPCDLTVGACGTDRVATVVHGPFGKPKFKVEEGIATLTLDNGLIPNITQWQADLARNVLWDIDLRAGLGDLTVDLSSLRIERFAARTRLGRLSLICPARGYTQMNLRSGLGEIEVRIPEHVGARLNIKHGALATVKIYNERLIALDDHRFTTPEFEASSAQVEIRIHSAAGDITIL